jgi:hypothetical protein
MSIQTVLKSLIVSDYPIRYHAYNHHKTIIEHESTITDNPKPCSELFYYYNEIHYQNEYNRKGYCVVKIYSMPNNYYLLEVEAEYPDRMRKQKVLTFNFDTYQEARQEAINQIEYIENWLLSDWWNELPETYTDVETWNEFRDHMKMIANDGTKIVQLVGNHNKILFNIDLKKYQHNEYFRVKIIN